jgi:hypothetical protein
MKTMLYASLSLLFVGTLTSFGLGQEKEATATAVAVPASPKMGPITVTVDLIGGQKISGTLTEVTQIPIRTAFGEASVPLAEVAGVKLATAEDTSTTIIMKNGDSITGATDLKVLQVDTEWGSAKINGSSVTSILLLPDLKWNATIGLNGRRWSLVDSKAPTSAGNSLLPSNPTSSQKPGSTTSQPIPNGARIINPTN